MDIIEYKMLSNVVVNSISKLESITAFNELEKSTVRYVRYIEFSHNE